MTIRIVVVDDHPIVRDGIISMVSREGDIEVVGEAASGPEAVIVVTRELPDVVLMDLRMPGGDGVDAVRELTAAEVPTRILVLTTYDTDRDIRAALGAGAHGYLLKDTPRPVLLQAVRDIAAGRPVLAPQALDAMAGRRNDPELTARELEVLRVIANGGTNRGAAADLMVSEATVKTHLNHAYQKLGVSDRAAAVRVAFERGLL
ncbi:response regulator [Gulosibacter molinativorax]|uniref:DNA-binding response regulator n=1 Tax=Gulosibacter molinativorax TaxID=256821 RepID=A0ABT7C9V7_9MICO|nr:response regulator transcription factor [Gulosibacter molinativorax]MDJ1371532.1 DNA-binding response regulator [Gulosibacter molinativorax]QUY62474.1 Two-component response regulator (YvqE) responding to cell wall stress [Gulosibacter molinativorax]